MTHRVQAATHRAARSSKHRHRKTDSLLTASELERLHAAPVIPVKLKQGPHSKGVRQASSSSVPNWNPLPQVIQGKKLQQETITENVSLSGFLCTCAAELPSGTTVEVFLTDPTPACASKAKIVHFDSKASLLRHYGFRFIEKTGPGVLN
jgi:hypothetical protein